jgi:hypothetical protein
MSLAMDRGFLGMSIMKLLTRLSATVLVFLNLLNAHAETNSFKEVSKQNNFVQYASSANGEQFWLDWELIDKSPKRQRYTRAISSTATGPVDFNIDCVTKRVSWIVNSWVTPDRGSVNEILWNKVCGKQVDGHTFVFGGVFVDMDVYVSLGTARYVSGDSGFFDVTATTSRPIGSYVKDSDWRSADYETLRIDCMSYRGYISKPHKITEKADFSAATQSQFDRELTLFKRVCDSERRLLGEIKSADRGLTNEKSSDASKPRDVNSLIRDCIGRGKTPGTAEFTVCMKSNSP